MSEPSEREAAIREAAQYLLSKRRLGSFYLDAVRLLLAEIDTVEAELAAARGLLLDVEGTILGHWTDIPQSECERLRLAIREVLGDWEPT